MALMLSKLYEALKAAGAPDEVAREAAEEGASFDERMQRIEVKLTRVETILPWLPALSSPFWCGSIGRKDRKGAPDDNIARDAVPRRWTDSA